MLVHALCFCLHRCLLMKCILSLYSRAPLNWGQSLTGRQCAFSAGTADESSPLAVIACHSPGLRCLPPSSQGVTNTNRPRVLRNSLSSPSGRQRQACRHLPSGLQWNVICNASASVNTAYLTILEPRLNLTGVTVGRCPPGQEPYMDRASTHLVLGHF